MLISLLRRTITSAADMTAGAAAVVVTSLPGSDEAKLRRAMPVIVARKAVDVPLKLL